MKTSDPKEQSNLRSSKGLGTLVLINLLFNNNGQCDIGLYY